MRFSFLVVYGNLLFLTGYSATAEVVVEPVAVTGPYRFFGPEEGNSLFSRFWNETNTPTDTKYDINRHGVVVFEATDGGRRGLWSSVPDGSPQIEISTSDSFDSDFLGRDVSIRLGSIDYPQVSESGQITFRGEADGRSDLGLWQVNRNSSARSAFPIALSSTRGGPFGPQTTPIDSFSSDGFSGLLDFLDFTYSLNRDSQIAFSGLVSRDSGIWRQSGRSAPEPLLLANTDGPLGPGIAGNVEFSSFGPPKINDLGDVVVSAKGDGDAHGVWKVLEDGTNRELLIAADDSANATSSFGFDFDLANVIDYDAQGNAALFLERKIDTFSDEFVGLGFAPVGKPAVQVAMSETDGVGGPLLGAGIKFELSDPASIMRTAVSGNSFAFVAEVDGGKSGIWTADDTGQLLPVAIDPNVLTQVDVPRIDGLRSAEIQLTPHGDLFILAGAELWRYADGKLTELIGSGLELDLELFFDPTNGLEAKTVRNVQSFDLHDSGWIAAEVELANNERALVRLNTQGIPEPPSLALFGWLGIPLLFMRSFTLAFSTSFQGLFRST